MKYRLFRIALWLMPFTVLAGCDTGAADGYTFGKETFLNTDLKVKVVLVESQSELRRIGPKVEGLMAFSKINPEAKTCTIYMVDSRKDYQPEWIGHELAHCVYGEWHQ